MKLIRVSAGLEMSIYDFPAGTYSEQNEFLRELIGNNCEIYEHVMPKRLYTELNMQSQPSKAAGQCVGMLVDEEGLLKENVPNPIGSYLYGTDKHNQPIMGNILFVGKKWTSDGIDFCGIEESVFKELEMQLDKMIHRMKKMKEAAEK